MASEQLGKDSCSSQGIIEAKINGQEIVQTPAEQESNVINIMEAEASAD